MRCSGSCGRSCGLENEVFLEDGLRLHGSEASEDAQNVAVTGGGDLGEKEQLVHFGLRGEMGKVVLRFEKADRIMFLFYRAQVRPAFTFVHRLHRYKPYLTRKTSISSRMQ